MLIPDILEDEIVKDNLAYIRKLRELHFNLSITVFDQDERIIDFTERLISEKEQAKEELTKRIAYLESN